MQFELLEAHVPLTDEQRERLPHVILVDPEHTRGAAYNSRRVLIVADVSADLLRFAINRHVQVGLWEPGLSRGPQQRPPWMPRGDLDDWMMYWVRDEHSTAEHLQSLPPK